MMKITARPHATLALLLCLGSSATLAAEPLPEEVEVIGQRQLYLLEEQLVEAEDAVFALYNELNTDDLYDVSCEWVKPLGTNMKHRVCRPGFISAAEQSRGQEYMSNVTGMGFTTGTSVELEYERHNPVLKRKLEEAVASSPELADLMMEHQELKAALDERKSGLFGRE